jgi:hypothetical protein
MPSFDCRGGHIVIEGKRYDVIPTIAVDGIWRRATLRHCPSDAPSVLFPAPQPSTSCGWLGTHSPHGACAGMPVYDPALDNMTTPKERP